MPHSSRLSAAIALGLMFQASAQLKHPAQPKSAGKAKAAPQASLAIAGVTVIDVVRGAAIANQTVLVADGRIVESGEANAVKIPPKAIRIPGEGRYLIPGLWDMHVHLRSAAENPDLPLVEENAALLDLFLPNGVVGVREMGGDLADSVLRWREEIRAGKRIGPRILTAGRKIDQVTPTWPGSLGVKNPAEAREAVRQMKQSGVDFIKVNFNRAQPEVLSAVVSEAHKLSLRVVGHWPANLPIEMAPEIGIDGIEHSQFLLAYRRNEYEQFERELEARKGSAWAADPAETMARQIYMLDDKVEALYRAMATKLIWVTPTLAVTTRVREDLGVRDFSSDARQTLLFPAIWQSWNPKIGRRKPVDGRLRELAAVKNRRAEQAVVAAFKAGVPMLAGSDCGANNNYMFPGWSLHDELESLVKAGLTPADALRMATIDAAQWRVDANSEGTIESGKVADLVLLRSNPLENVRHTREIEAVVKAGRYFPRLELDEMLQRAKERAAKARPEQ